MWLTYGTRYLHHSSTAVFTFDVTKLLVNGAIDIGGDVGGSIRMPAFFNGIFGHKPSGGGTTHSYSFAAFICAHIHVRGNEC
jgi:hypothetical protein